MQKARDIKRRINSIENTRQITHTMEMVAASKMRRARERVEAARPYADKLAEVISGLFAPELAEKYPILRQPEGIRKSALILLTSNRGLAGAFNVNLIRKARDTLESLESDGTNVEFHVIGKKGIGFFRFRGQSMASTRQDIDDRPTMDDARSIIDPLLERFEDGGLDAIDIVYAQFKSALSTPPAVMRVLPLSPPDETDRSMQRNYIFKPSAEEILTVVLPLYVRNAAYRALVETAAAEQGARRTAMKNATDNADELVKNLTRDYNRARQTQITQELAEITGGAEALRG